MQLGTDRLTSIHPFPYTLGFPDFSDFHLPTRYRARGYAVGVASRLATVIYVAMVMPILYDNPYQSKLKYESYWLYG